eukprot:GEMP01056689.1.p1 GENE.GEMP01056689.1~~GEMP01056689.1.p1  ORF type:complete len:284 (+),score=77.55 GEMP01056689.1:88-939(+)
MDKYRRVAKEKDTSRQTPEDEIRITASGRTAVYITYAAKLFNEKELEKCTIKATGTALATAVTVVEIIKRRFKGLHQITKLGSIEIVDEYEPLEEGLDKVTDVRQVSFIEVTLSKAALDEKNPGYQPPLSDDLVKEVSAEEIARGRGGRGRGPRKGKGKGKGKAKGKGKGKGKSGSKGRSDSPGKAGGEKGGKKGKKSKGAERDRSESRGKKGGKKGKSTGYEGYSTAGYGYDYGDSYGYSSYGAYGQKGAAKGGKGKGKKGFEEKGKGKKGKGKGFQSKGYY